LAHQRLRRLKARWHRYGSSRPSRSGPSPMLRFRRDVPLTSRSTWSAPSVRPAGSVQHLQPPQRLLLRSRLRRPRLLRSRLRPHPKLRHLQPTPADITCRLRLSRQWRGAGFMADPVQSLQLRPGRARRGYPACGHSGQGRVSPGTRACGHARTGQCTVQPLQGGRRKLFRLALIPGGYVMQQESRAASGRAAFPFLMIWPDDLGMSCCQIRAVGLGSSDERIKSSHFRLCRAGA
jgi:hypothetical protein